MQQERLTENGIEKLMGNIPGVIVQVLGVQQKEKNNTRFFGCQLSDGYCKLRGCLIVDEQAFTSNKVMKEFLIIKILSSSLQHNKQKQPILIVQFYKPVVENISQVVGKPLYYEDFTKKGKNNPEGNNLIIKDSNNGQPAQKGNKTIKRQQVFQESKTNDENGKIKNMMKNNKEKDSNSRPYSKDNSNSNTVYQSKLNIGPKMDQKANHKSQSKEINRNDPKMKTGPIQRIQKKQQRKSSPMPKGQQRKPTNQYTEIKSLYTGMQNWTVLARVLFVNPVRQIMTKKGTESSVLNFQIGDKSGTMECTIFGETAQRFEGTLKQDQVYEISSAMIQESSYLGKHELKMTIGEQTKVNLKQDDSSIPFSQDFCITVKQLTQIPIGQTARVICLIKDQNQPINFTSKAGKQLRKKPIYLCDPEEKIQVEVILWNDKSQLRFEKFPYMIKGVIVSQYRESRQYGLKPICQYRILKQHNLRKYIKDMDSIAFFNPDSNHKPRQSNITNFSQLKNSNDDVGGSGIWSQVVCYLSNIRLSSKNFYISCPSCKKKVQHEEDSECQHCRKPYQHAKYRYILNVNLCDNHDSIWATAYDQVGEQLMGTNGQILTAKQFSQMKEDELGELLRILRFKHLKLKMVTKNEEYNNEIRKKTSIIKILELNYAEETKCVLAKLQSLLRD